MKIPLGKQLKKRSQIEVAILQDELVDIIYSIVDDAVLHGGTAIWRCYSGKRFSEDIDLYSQSFSDSVRDFSTAILSRGLTIGKLKDTGRVIYSSVSNGRSEVRVEINHFSTQIGKVSKFELVDGSYIEVLSLTPEQLIREKMEAYRDRRFIRDIYDIYHLVGIIGDLGALKRDFLTFLKEIGKPVDEQVLKTIVYSGIPPTFEGMVIELKRVVR